MDMHTLSISHVYAPIGIVPFLLKECVKGGYTIIIVRSLYMYFLCIAQERLKSYLTDDQPS